MMVASAERISPLAAFWGRVLSHESLQHAIDREADRGETGEYAIKMVDKKMVQVRDRSKGVLTERQMLLELEHPGIATASTTEPTA
ncbi:unnamed protein product [Durusdinium trenchii]|uniref:Uncharacterized protein n=1 Tax=Durusdinium trenchii TaxID=1381693 RepID=A0ABP0Q7R0_9DINO